MVGSGDIFKQAPERAGIMPDGKQQDDGRAWISMFLN